MCPHQKAAEMYRSLLADNKRWWQRYEHFVRWSSFALGVAVGCVGASGGWKTVLLHSAWMVFLWHFFDGLRWVLTRIHAWREKRARTVGESGTPVGS